MAELKKIFHASDGSVTENMMVDTLEECERAASKGGTKRYVSSAEDMIDFATSVLGHNIVVRSTENVNGLKDILIGSVKGISGGKVTDLCLVTIPLPSVLLPLCTQGPSLRSGYTWPEFEGQD